MGFKTKSDNEDTTIAIKKKTRERMKSFGRKGDTYDSILNRFMDWIDEDLKKPKISQN